MRTMKRVAAVALSVVVLMTSGVSAKAAVTDVQPAKSSSEAVLKWAKKVGEPFDEKTYANNTVSKIKLVGNYLYVADDAKHRIMKIDKKDGTILKEQKYCDESYIQGLQMKIRMRLTLISYLQMENYILGQQRRQQIGMIMVRHFLIML